jgi:hypothetical protein
MITRSGWSSLKHGETANIEVEISGEKKCMIVKLLSHWAE